MSHSKVENFVPLAMHWECFWCIEVWSLPTFEPYVCMCLGGHLGKNLPMFMDFN